MSTVRSFLNGRVVLHSGDCVAVLATLPANAVDSIVCDPPYGLEFMGKEWDGADGFRRSLNAADAGRDSVFGRTSKKAPEYRTAGTGRKGKPGIGARDTEWVSNAGWNQFRCGTCGHLFHGGSPCQCETPTPVRADNRWNLFQEWCEAWAREALRVLKPGGHIVAFSGTRTYHRMACAIEDAGFEIRDQLAWAYGSGMPKGRNLGKALEAHIADLRRDLDGFTDRSGYEYDEITDALAAAAADLDRVRGWNTSLKPAWEPICLARKPLTGNVLDNMRCHGVGGINGDGCRVDANARPLRELDSKATDSSVYVGRSGQGGLGKGLDGGSKAVGTTDVGRWPANLIHDGSHEVIAAFPDSAGQQGDVRGTEQSRTGGVGTNCYGEYGRIASAARNDSGSAARFFYTSKADADDRLGSKHPTVKPLDLMQWLVRLVTPKGGTCLDPFAGTGTTGEAAWREGMNAILIEREVEYQDDIARRLELAENPTKRAAVAKTKNNLDNPHDLPLFADRT